MKKWSSQWTQFMQLRKEAWKKIQRLPVRFSTNWAMKPLTLGAGQLWVHMFPWKNWVLMIYEVNHVGTTEMKWRCLSLNVSGFIAQLVEHRTGIARSRVQTPLKSWIFSGFFTQLHKLRSLRRSFLHLHLISAVPIWFISYIISTRIFLFLQCGEYYAHCDWSLPMIY